MVTFVTDQLVDNNYKLTDIFTPDNGHCLI
nr:MAG TPA: hypothetical protein [Caudoviricetes sp.]